MPPSGLSHYEFASNNLWVGLLKKTQEFTSWQKGRSFWVGSNMAHKKHGPFFEGIDGMMWWEAAAAFSFWKKTRKSYTDHVSPYKQLLRACCRGKFFMDVESSWIPQTILYQTDSRCSHAGLLWFPLAKTLEQKHCWIQPQCWKYCWITPVNFEDFQQKIMSYLPHSGKKKSTKQVGFFRFFVWRRWAHQIASLWRHHWLAPNKNPPLFPPCSRAPGTWAPPQPGKWTFFFISSARELGTFQAFLVGGFNPFEKY